MGKIYGNLEEMIGNTPIVRLERLERALGLTGKIFAKLEWFNPGGSSKDRIAHKMLDEAEKAGLIKPAFSCIIEPTSGNTGIGLATVAVLRGYRTIIVMPESMSEERKLLMRAHGAELVLTEAAKGMAGAIERAKELAAEIEMDAARSGAAANRAGAVESAAEDAGMVAVEPGVAEGAGPLAAWIPGQFENPAGPRAHYETTGLEIWTDMDGVVDGFVCGVGTGGTLSGVGKYLKEKKPAIRVIAVEPEESAVLSGKEVGRHGIQGIGAGFIPEVLDRAVYDEVIGVATDAAYEMSRKVAETEGFLIGISSGAAMQAAAEVAKRPEMRGKNIVVLLPDSGERYLSVGLYK